MSLLACTCACTLLIGLCSLSHTPTVFCNVTWLATRSLQSPPGPVQTSRARPGCLGVATLRCLAWSMGNRPLAEVLVWSRLLFRRGSQGNVREFRGRLTHRRVEAVACDLRATQALRTRFCSCAFGSGRAPVLSFVGT